MMKKQNIKWCDPSCPNAVFPEESHLDGACRTFIALYCRKHERLVQKSGLCLDIAEESDPSDD
jgi:hypothetical protein